MSPGGSCTVVGADGLAYHAALDQPPREIDEPYEYFLNICRHLARDHGFPGLDYRIVHDSGSPLPGLSRRSVVLVVADEHCRLPRAATEASLVCRCFGARPDYPWQLRLEPTGLLDYARYLREVLRFEWDRVTLGREGARHLIAAIMPIPMGYCRQLPLPIEPIETRPHLLSFRGSVDNHKAARLSYRALADRPKRLARLRMLDAVHRLARELPPGSIELRITESFAVSAASSALDYSRSLMQTQICLCPRGTRGETYRIHEALRSGCVVVSERLSASWYLTGSPVIQIDDWRELRGIVHALRQDWARMRELHERALAWWHEMLSPRAVAARVAVRLAATDGPPAHSPVVAGTPRVEAC